MENNIKTINTEKSQQTQSDSQKYEKETARRPKTEIIRLHSEDEDYVAKAILNIRPTLETICKNNGWTYKAMLERLDPKYFGDQARFSKLINNCTKRQISAGQLFEIRRVSGISLDKLADGCDAFEFGQMTIQRLIELNNIISAELLRRIMQKK